jgi:putative endonuclease
VNDPRHQLGRRAEELAEKFLRRAGLKTVARRFSTPLGEIDLVMRQGDTVVFVEVKARRSADLADPQDAVGSDKQRRLLRTARLFLRQRGWEDRPCRFDVVGVVWPEKGSPSIEHLPDAFVPDD